jgi:hypothetical protein
MNPLLLLSALLAALVFQRAQAPHARARVVVARQLPAQAVQAAEDEDAPLAIKPVKYTFTLEEIDNFNYQGVGCEIEYGITGSNIASVNTDALNITAVTDADGNDLLAFASRGRRRGNHNQFLNRSSGTYGDGKRATFSLFIPTENPMTLPKISGTINIRTAGQAETETLTFKTGEAGIEQMAGPFAFSIDDDEKTLRTWGFSKFAMTMKGDNKHIKSVALNAGGKKIDNRGSSSNKETTIYFFADAPTTSEFTLTVVYYTDLRETPLSLDGKPLAQDVGW